LRTGEASRPVEAEEKEPRSYVALERQIEAAYKVKAQDCLS